MIDVKLPTPPRTTESLIDDLFAVAEAFEDTNPSLYALMREAALALRTHLPTGTLVWDKPPYKLTDGWHPLDHVTHIFLRAGYPERLRTTPGTLAMLALDERFALHTAARFWGGPVERTGPWQDARSAGEASHPGARNEFVCLVRARETPPALRVSRGACSFAVTPAQHRLVRMTLALGGVVELRALARERRSAEVLVSFGLGTLEGTVFTLRPNVTAR